MTWKDARQEAERRLKNAGIAEYQYEAWVFMEWKLGVSRADYFMNPETEIPEKQKEAFKAALEKRERRVPLQYLMGNCEFMGNSFLVDERVLIPRQDTECLVELAVKYIREDIKKKETLDEEKKPPRVLDLCAGSGCIGISIKLFCPEAEVTLADISSGALAVAEENARRLGAEVGLTRGDLFQNVKESYDYILSNPPYIPSETIDGLMPEVKTWEPRLALDGAEDGLYFYRKIAGESSGYLQPGGVLMFEIGSEQGEELRKILQKQKFEQIEIKKDLAGLDRIVLARRKAE